MRSSGGNRPIEKCRSVQNTETLGPQSADSATASLRTRSSACGDSPASVTGQYVDIAVASAEPGMGQAAYEIRRRATRSRAPPANAGQDGRAKSIAAVLASSSGSECVIVAGLPGSVRLDAGFANDRAVFLIFCWQSGHEILAVAKVGSIFQASTCAHWTSGSSVISRMASLRRATTPGCTLAGAAIP